MNDFQAITAAQRPVAKLRWRNGLTVVLYHNTPRQELLAQEKLLDRAGQHDLNHAAIRCHAVAHQAESEKSQSFQTAS